MVHLFTLTLLQPNLSPVEPASGCDTPLVPDPLVAEAGELLDDAIALRRELHRNPELGLDLPKTQQLVLESMLAPMISHWREAGDCRKS